MPHCQYLATRGFVAATAEYRVRNRDKTTPYECVADGKSAVRWLRAHASELGIDPDRIAAGGGSAGGHVAACTGITEGGDDPADANLEISSRPDALLLFNPVLDVGPTGFGHRRMGEDWRTISPQHRITEKAPPTIVFHGTTDTTVPFQQAASFQRAMVGAGNRCELLPFPDRKHGFFNKNRGLPDYLATVRAMDRFLVSLGWISGAPTILDDGDPGPPSYHALRNGLANCRIKFSGTAPSRVAFLGGSITHNHGWRDLVGEELRRRFPKADIDLINAGIPSFGSTPNAFRLERDVLSKGPVDLLFVEAAVNDATNGRSPIEMIRGMEGIIRHARRANPAIDIVMMQFVDPEKMGLISKGRVPPVIIAHERVAEHYQIASLDLAREVTDRIAAGEFTWKGDFKNLHPSPFGQKLYFNSIKRLLDAAWDGPLKNAIIDHPDIDEPIDASCYSHGRLVDISQASALRGFSLDPNWRPADGGRTRPGFVDVPMLVASHAGASLEFAFTGTAVGIMVAAGQDAGVLEAKIDGKDLPSTELFTRWSARLHLPWTHVLAAGLEPGEHLLHIRLAKSKHPGSSGHAARIACFTVNSN